MSPSRIADQAGRVLGGRYRLIARIGSGASGHVFLASDITLGRRVAVKLLHATLAGDEAFLRRFQAEAQAAAVLNHPNLMGILDWGEDEDGPFLVLEHLGGGSLADLLDSGYRLSPGQAAAVGLEAARGLAYAHRRGLVHRDVKPANLLFDDEGRLCIADFGVARALAEAAWTEPVGALIGTVRYSSPEAAQGRSLDGRADLYALGLVLIEAVTGVAPFAADTTIATLMARVGTAPPVPPAMGPLVPVVSALTQPEPEDRPDAAMAVGELEALERELPRPEPLPLAGPARNVSGPEADSTDRACRSVPVVLLPEPSAVTEVLAREPWAPAGFEPRGTAGNGTARDDTQADSFLPFAERPPATGSAPPPPSPPSGPGRRRRRWPWVAAPALVVALAGAGVGARTLLVPSYRVPGLQGLTVAGARARVSAADRFRIVASGSRYSPVVPGGDILTQSPRRGAMLRRGSTLRVTISRGQAPRAVPDLQGDTRSPASAALAQAGFVARFVTSYNETVPAGRVVVWSPSTGLQPHGATVVVTLSRGPHPRIVPTLARDGYGQAAGRLRTMGLVPAETRVYSNTIPAGHVVSELPRPGQRVPRGATVTLSVSLGPHLVTMPNVVGESAPQAVAALQATGLVANLYGPNTSSGVVIATVPQPGSTVHFGASVDVYVL